MSNEITFNAKLSEAPRTRAHFTYKMTPTVISITDTGLGSRSVTEDIEAVLRKVEHWHQGSIVKFKIMCRNGKDSDIAFDGTSKPHPYSLCRKPMSGKQTKSYQSEKLSEPGTGITHPFISVCLRRR